MRARWIFAYRRAAGERDLQAANRHTIISYRPLACPVLQHSTLPFGWCFFFLLILLLLCFFGSSNCRCHRNEERHCNLFDSFSVFGNYSLSCECVFVFGGGHKTLDEWIAIRGTMWQCAWRSDHNHVWDMLPAAGQLLSPGRLWARSGPA